MRRAFTRVFQFRVILRDVEPPVWRQIQVPEVYSFWDLHVAIQDAMGWLDYHLHAFTVTEPRTGAPQHIGIPDDDFEEDPPVLAGWEIPIAYYFRSPSEGCRYEYDFGDGWEHDLVFEGAHARQPGVRYPRCLGGERACPPEDCGGPSGYEDFLEAIADPDHEEHESYLNWVGGSFLPDQFDPAEIHFDDPRKRWKVAFSEE